MPSAAVVELGNQQCCYLLEGDKSIKTPIQAGLADGKWIEVSNKLVQGEWQPFTGTEQVILGDLSQLVDGEPVEVVKNK